jgi:hypothetical protein
MGETTPTAQELGEAAMSPVDVDPTMPATRPERATCGSIALLISVPRVAAPRVRPEGTMRLRPIGRGRSPARPGRRRLRREVRLAGWALLSLVPLLGAGTLDWGSLRSRVLALPVSIALATNRDRAEVAAAIAPELPAGEPVSPTNAPPVVVLSIEPALGAPVSDAEIPVVFPGYLLPDDSLEEPAHEGS